MSTELDLRRLQDEVGAWSDENFGVSPLHGGDGSPPEHALIGIGEELGELTRSVLKREQGIADDDKYADRDDVGPAAEKDAVGDVMIYLMDCLYRSEDDIYVADGLQSSVENTAYGSLETPIQAIRSTYADYGRLSGKRFHLIPDTPDDLETVENNAGDLANSMVRFCEIRGYDFDACVLDAWNEVSDRDWDADVGAE